MTLSDAANTGRYRQGSALRSFFRFLKFISVCVGTAYVFTSKISANSNCELIRFYLGIVCFSMWVLIFIWPPKPSLPRRRSLMIVSLVFIFSIIFNSIYFGVVIRFTIKTKNSECVYTRIEDLYFRAPLKLFAYVGLILAVCTVVNNSLAAILNQLYYRLMNFRRFFIYVSAIHYAISYSTTVVIVYYYSVGAVLLFRPRSGGSCAAVAPDFYKVLWIWHLILVFPPLAIWPLTFLVCCLSVALGACLLYCFPASIIVPLLEMLGERLMDIYGANNQNTPSSPNTIEALPMVVFGEASNEFNQTECVICKTNYKANENVKRLPCGHFFHQSCVAHWLAITRICPVCRHRISSTTL
ncbi:unnamed protein product [Rotaria sp. Silwood1]|nr:unnamed protein product [Rotaria sp. Silwood1]CAF3509953.1 unnamed protein product [Rotaria sp. Silwood1]CAF3527745.1 unnamed protein product [Rotaria sp. Silwood1]CAF4713974.1 unnamed protein product [Rotaria sp. Silwood1]CAF4723134.1 unnamed protein product [Rotaria sp. Silwood1]